MKTTILEKNSETILKNLSSVCRKGCHAHLSYDLQGEVHSCDGVISKLDYQNKYLVIDHIDMNFYREFNQKDFMTIFIEGTKKSLKFKENLKTAFVGTPLGYQQMVFEIPEYLEIFDKRQNPRLGFGECDNIIVQMKDENILTNFKLNDISLGGLSVTITDSQDLKYFSLDKEVLISSIGNLCFLVPIKAHVIHVHQMPYIVHFEFLRKLDQFSDYSLEKLVKLIK